MNKLKKLLVGAFSLIMMVGCSDDVLNTTEQDYNGNNSDDPNAPGVYIGVNFYMPSGMGANRSFTNGENSSNSGEEVGSDIENNINEVLLVLASNQKNGNNQYGFIGAATVMRNKIYQHTEDGNNAYHSTAKFNKTALETYYTTNPTDDKSIIAVFVIVNPSGQLVDFVNNDALCRPGNTEWINYTHRVTVDMTGGGQGQTEGAVWSTTNGGSFLMCNSRIALRQIPAKMEEWSNYTTEDKHFNLSEVNGISGTTSYIDNSSGVTGRGAVLVERAAARMDFKDGSPLGNRTYHVIYLQASNGEDDMTRPIVDIRLNKMCLVNMAKDFYYFKRVSNNGFDDMTAGNGFEICGPAKPWYVNANGTYGSTPGNYIVECNAPKFANLSKTGLPDLFNYSFFDENGTFNVDEVDAPSSRWYVSQISDVLADDATKDNWKDGNGDTGTYKVWRYLTENTIPGVEFQKNGISTGVVFKGKMQAIKDRIVNLSTIKDENSMEYRNAYYNNMLINAINNEGNILGKGEDVDPILYNYAGSLYVTWDNIREAAIRASFSYTFDADGNIVPDWNRTNSLYKVVFGEGGSGFSMEYKDKNGNTALYSDDLGADQNSANYLYDLWKNPTSLTTEAERATNLANFKAAVTGNDVKIFQSSYDPQNGWGYYCYYYYWNRHNDNGKDGIMGPMEFAVVRNNVYKLAVTKISMLGHPRLSSNDPNPPTPDTDDETSDVYMTVDTQVIPWVVRVNNITFE